MVKKACRLCPLIPYFAVAIFMYGLQNAWVAMLAYHGCAVGFVILARDMPRFSKPQRISASILPMAAIFALGGAIFYYVWPYLGPGSGIEHKLAWYGVNPRSWPYVAIYFCLVNACAEEFFWRGSLGSDSPLPVLNDFLFAGYHAFVLLAFTSPLWTIPVVIACVFAGWLWRMIRRKYGGFAVPIITHIIADSSIVGAVHLRLFR